MWRKSRPVARLFVMLPKTWFQHFSGAFWHKERLDLGEINMPKHIIWWWNVNKNGNLEQHCKENVVSEKYSQKKMRMNTWSDFYWNHKPADAKIWRQKMVDGIEMKMDRLFFHLMCKLFINLMDSESCFFFNSFLYIVRFLRWLQGESTILQVN